MGDGTPGGLIIEKRVFLIFFSCGASRAVFIDIALVQKRKIVVVKMFHQCLVLCASREGQRKFSLAPFPL